MPPFPDDSPELLELPPSRFAPELAVALDLDLPGIEIEKVCPSLRV